MASLPQATQTKVKESTQSLFSQLAKELGLEFPPEAPSSQPKPTASQRSRSVETPSRAVVKDTVAVAVPAAAARGVYTSQSKTAVSNEDWNERIVADSDSGKDMTSAPGIARVESANAAAYFSRDKQTAIDMATIRADFLDGESLRRAFILKTILEKPLSLRL